MKLVVLVSALAAVVLLAACGSSGGPKANGEAARTANQIIADAQAAAIAASSVHVAGIASQALSLDLQLVAGKGGKGHLTAGGLTFEIVRIGPTAYFKGDSAFWRHFGGAGAVQLLRGRWLKAPAGNGKFSSFTPLTDMPQLFQGILGSHGTLERGKETTIHGLPAIAVVDTSNGGTLYVATTGEPYPLEIQKKDGTGTIDFKDWNATVALAAPKDAVDISKLGG